MAIVQSITLRRSGVSVLLGLLLTGSVYLDAIAKHGRDNRWDNHPKHRWHRESCEVRRVHPPVCAPIPPARRVYVAYGGQPFYWNASLSLYVPGVWMDVTVGELPRGSRVHDPYCDRVFRNVRAYRSHLRRCDHPAVAEVIVGSVWRKTDCDGFGRR